MQRTGQSESTRCLHLSTVKKMRAVVLFSTKKQNKTKHAWSHTFPLASRNSTHWHFSYALHKYLDKQSGPSSSDTFTVHIMLVQNLLWKKQATHLINEWTCIYRALNHIQRCVSGASSSHGDKNNWSVFYFQNVFNNVFKWSWLHLSMSPVGFSDQSKMYTFIPSLSCLSYLSFSLFLP